MSPNETQTQLVKINQHGCQCSNLVAQFDNFEIFVCVVDIEKVREFPYKIFLMFLFASVSDARMGSHFARHVLLIYSACWDCFSIVLFEVLCL